jgi:hypothetical protein
MVSGKSSKHVFPLFTNWDHWLCNANVLCTARPTTNSINWSLYLHRIVSNTLATTSTFIFHIYKMGNATINKNNTSTLHNAEKLSPSHQSNHQIAHPYTHATTRFSTTASIINNTTPTNTRFTNCTNICIIRKNKKTKRTTIDYSRSLEKIEYILFKIVIKTIINITFLKIR